MTLREVFGALLRGAWIIIAVAVIAGLAGYFYQARVPVTYTSVATVRANTFLTDAIANGSIGGIPADLDPSVMLTPTILDPIATDLGVSEAALARSLSVVPAQDGRTLTVTVTATASTGASSIARANAVVDAYVALVNSTAASSLAALQAAVAATTVQIQFFQSQLAANPTDPVASASLAAAFSTLSTQTTQVTTVQGAGTLIVVQQRATDAISSQPPARVVIPLAILCGLLAGAGLALLLDRVNDRVRSAEEVETLTRITVLSELPYDRSAARRRKKNRLPAASGRQGVLGERLRSLRTSIQVLLPDGKGVVVLTSVEPGDGKTFVSSNLAVSWSRAGRKVILVAGDMRRPEVGNYFEDVDGARGLSDLLALRVPGRRSPTQPQIEETLVGTRFRGLRVLPPGSETDDAADLLGTSNLPRVMGFAGRIADVVVVDSPPALALADASEMARSADGVVLIATLGRTRRRLLRAAIETLRANDVTIFGIVVNRSRRKLPRTYADYYMAKSAPRKDRTGARPARPVEEPVFEERRTRGRAPEPAPVFDEPDHGVGDLDDLDAALSGRDRRLAALGLDDPEDR